MAEFKRKSLGKNLLLVAVCLLLLAAAQVAAKARYFYFDIAAGMGVDAALNRLSEQSESLLLLPYDQVKSITANGLKGRYTLERALQIVLKNTGFEAQINEKGVITVKPVRNDFFGDGSTTEEETAGGKTGMEEIVVSGIMGIRKSFRSSINLKRQTETIADTLSASDIGQLPALTIADSLELVTGVAGDKNRGVSSQLSLRGLGPALTAATLNGREQATSSPSRNIRFSQYPAELISGVTVYKSSPADAVEGGISGTVELQTMGPLDYADTLTRINLRQTYDEVGRAVSDSDAYGTRGVLVHIGQYLDDTLGVALGVAGQDAPLASARGANARAQSFGQDYDGDGTVDAAVPTTVYQLSAEEQQRNGVVLSTQWAPDRWWEWNFSGFYTRLQKSRHREQLRYHYLFDQAPTLINPEVEKGVLQAFELGPDRANRIEPMTILVERTDELYDFGLNGKWEGDTWSLSGDIAYSRATQDRWGANLLFRKNGIGALGYRGGSGRVASVYPLDRGQLTDIAGFSHRQVEVITEDIDDSILAFRLDIERHMEVQLPGDISLGSLEFGVRFSEREKDRERQEFVDIALRGEPVDTALLNGFLYDDLDVLDIDPKARNPWITFDAGAVMSAYGGVALPPPADTDLLMSWRVGEEKWAGYLKANIQGTLGALPYFGNIGARLLHTSVDVSSHRHTLVGDATGFFIDGVVPVSADNDLSELLPSFNINFRLQEDLLLRVGLSRVVTLPPLDQLSPARDLSRSPTGGNPHLDPFRAEHYDISLEWYIDDDSALFAAIYYKDVESFIGVESVTESLDGIGLTLQKPVNGRGGIIRGLEFTYQQAFTFLPAPLDGLGAMLNYSYTDSTASRLSGDRPDAVDIGVIGFSQHVGSAVVYYSKHNLNFRAQYTYRSEFTNQELKVLDDDARLAISAGYKFNEHLRFYLEGLNLSEEADSTDFPESGGLNRVDYTGRRYSVGFEYSF